MSRKFQVNVRPTISGRLLSLKYGVAAAAFALAPGFSFAQTAAAPTPPSGPSKDSPTLGEVVVTAQRTKTTAQRAPIALDVYSGAELRQNGVHDIATLTLVAPAVSITGEGSTTIVTIRGISSRDTTEIGDPAVAISTDGFYQDRTYTVGLVNYDMDRIEVLKGPQGTLEGRNATAGAINLISAQPTFTYGGYASVEAGDYSALNAEGAVNVPLTDTLAIRASFASLYHDGYRSVGAEGRADDQNAKSGRIQLLWEPLSNLKVHFLAEQTSQRAAGAAVDEVPFAVNAQGVVLHAAPDLGSTTNFQGYDAQKLDLDQTAIRGDIEYSFPWAKIEYYGGYSRVNFDGIRPELSTFSGPAGTNPTVTPVGFYQHEIPTTQNQEFRVSSPTQDGFFFWQAGLFYFHDFNDLDSYILYPNTQSILRQYLYTIEFNSLSEFAQIGFQPITGVKFTFGIRYNDDKKQRLGFLYSNNGASSTNEGGLYHRDKATYHAGVEYQITPTDMIYAKYDTGYKAGGFNTGGGAYAPETVETYEVGSKNRFYNNRLQFNIDAYLSNYQGQQESIYIATATSTVQTVNAGSTRIYGVEGEVQALTSIGKLGLTTDYLHARFTNLVVNDPIYSYVGGTLVTTNNDAQLAGNAPPQAPDWSIGAYLEHDWPVWNGTVTARVQTKFQTAQNFTIYNFPDDRQGAYTNSSLTVGYGDKHGWRVEAFVRNLENSAILTQAYEYSFARAYIYNFAPPRTYGARLSLTF